MYAVGDMLSTELLSLEKIVKTRANKNKNRNLTRDEDVAFFCSGVAGGLSLSNPFSLA